MPITVTPTKEIPDVLIIEPKVFGDARGWFYESFNQQEFTDKTGITKPFVQDNHSFSKQYILRGLHYQMEKTQGKLVRVTHGKVFDVAVDLRQSSRTFGKWKGIELSSYGYLKGLLMDLLFYQRRPIFCIKQRIIGIQPVNNL
jgi:dTDP-4-dehydrorhamnose 3,5-epimerase